MWLVGSLYGGFVVANVLKWYWWRFNGHGYFWGMIAGVGGALVMGVPGVTEAIFGRDVNLIYTFPLLFVVSLAGSLAGTFATPPEDDAVLMGFYRTVNPWGFWGPVREKVLRADPTFVPNRDAARDLSNVAVGIVWQTCLAIAPHLPRPPPGAPGRSPSPPSSRRRRFFLKVRWYDRLRA